MTNPNEIDWENPFKASDLKIPDYSSRGFTAGEVEFLVAHLNARFRELIKNAPVVYSDKSYKEPQSWDLHKLVGDTHSAKLICIEELFHNSI